MPPMPSRLTVPLAVTSIVNGFGTNVSENVPSISMRFSTVICPWISRKRPGLIETFPVWTTPLTRYRATHVLPQPVGSSSPLVRKVTVCSAFALPWLTRSSAKMFTSSRNEPLISTPGIASESRSSVTRPMMPGLNAAPVPSGRAV